MAVAKSKLSAVKTQESMLHEHGKNNSIKYKISQLAEDGSCFSNNFMANKRINKHSSIQQKFIDQVAQQEIETIIYHVNKLMHNDKYVS